MSHQSMIHFLHLAVPRTGTLVTMLLVCALLNGCGGGDDDDASSSEPASGADTSLLPMTITEWMFPPDVSTATGAPVGLAHFSITPMQPGANTITVSLTDLQGAPLTTAGDDSMVDVRYRTLTADSTTSSVTLDPADDQPATWQVDNLDLATPDWYTFDVRLHRPDGDVAAMSQMYMVLPDPSVYGPDAPDLLATDPDAEKLYQQALDTLGTWKAAKWRDSLGSGEDVLVVSEFTVTNRPDQPPAQRARFLYTGAFRTQRDGAGPAPPRRNYAGRVTIGERGWSRDGREPWTPQPAIIANTFAERAGTYTGATNIRMGGTATINGTETQIVTFYLPAQNGASEAWFAWCIDPDTGNLQRLVMVAKQHFMIWDFYDINGSYTIAPPSDVAAATPAAT